jgi:hypothetical protein
MFPNDYPKRKLGDPHVGFRPYAEAGSTALATIPLETLKPAIWFSNADACRQILDLHETRFRKDMKAVSGRIKVLIESPVKFETPV